jgi:dienelactone hydrolase
MKSALPKASLMLASLTFALSMRLAIAATAVLLPTPAGVFGIGRAGFDWIDQTRPDRFSADPQAHRELMVYLWYPASQKNEGARGLYLPGAKQMDALSDVQQRMREDYADNWPLIVSGAIYSHAMENAPAAKSAGKFPVVIFSHGLGGSGFGYTALIEDLVSHGYVVAAIEHTYTAGAVVFQNGRVVGFHRDQVPAGLSSEEAFRRMMSSVAAEITEGAGDVRFVLSKLTELNVGGVGQFPLAGRLDLTEVAAMGHSAGAEFATRACQLESRFKACVDLDGGMVPVAALPEYPDKATLQQPLLFLEAFHPEANMGGTHEQHLEYEKKKEAQLQECRPGSYSVILSSPGMVHGSFSDSLLFSAGGRNAETSIALHNLQLAEAFIRAFLDKTLKGQEAPLLDSADAEHSEVLIRHIGR